MPRWAGTTTQRGLGSEHQALRAAKLRTLVDGTPCRRCGYPMYHPTRCQWKPCDLCILDLGHYQPRVMGGRGPRELEHRKCNRKAGARLGNKLRRAVSGYKRQHSRRW